MPISVLLVDDSAIIRGLMSKALSADPAIVVSGSAADGMQGIHLARELKPDVIILDIEMPVMDGITALPELVKVSPHSKIIIASTLTTRNAAVSLLALSLGASDYLAKPSSRSGNEVEHFYRELMEKVLALGRHQAAKPGRTYPQLAPGERLNPFGIAALAIASSTGGPQVLTYLFTRLKGKLGNVPIFITQHMPPTFTAILASQLGKCGERICREGRSGERVLPGHSYIAPGDFHMVMEKNAAGEVIIRLNQEPQENFCRPAADPMLRSLTAIYGRQLAVVVLTGMGQDGMQGAKTVVANGGSVVAQDEASCVVYGMPRAVVENRLCKAVLPPDAIAELLIRQIEGPL